jgi:hypothetical protein
MKNVALVVASNRSIPSETQASLHRLVAAGALQHNVEGSSDVAFARNVSLSILVETFRREPARNVALLIDDDMVFTLLQAMELCAHVHGFGRPASGIYPTAVGEIAATSALCPFPGRWLAGLGFFAIPRDALLKLADESPSWEWRDGKTLWEFTNSALHEIGERRLWVGEDYWLSYRLGGVDLLPIAVGHLKMIPLYADDETVRRVRDGVRLGRPGAERVPFRVSTGEGAGLTVQQPERPNDGQGDIK